MLFLGSEHIKRIMFPCSRMTKSNSNNHSRRPKRQVRNYSKYEELAERTGGLAVRTTRDRVEEVMRMLEAEQYPGVRERQREILILPSCRRYGFCTFKRAQSAVIQFRNTCSLFTFPSNLLSFSGSAVAGCGSLIVSEGEGTH